MTIRAFKDANGGYYQTDVADNEQLPEWAASLIPCDVTPVAPPPNPRKVEIVSHLATLDQRKIRPLAEGDTTYLAALNAQTVALRAELSQL